MPSQRPQLRMKMQDPTQSSISRCIRREEWKKYRAVIQQLHLERVKRKQMLSILGEKYSFCPSIGQLSSQLKTWGFRVHKKPTSKGQKSTSTSANENEEGSQIPVSDRMFSSCDRSAESPTPKENVGKATLGKDSLVDSGNNTVPNLQTTDASLPRTSQLNRTRKNVSNVLALSDSSQPFVHEHPSFQNSSLNEGGACKTTGDTHDVEPVSLLSTLGLKNDSHITSGAYRNEEDSTMALQDNTYKPSYGSGEYLYQPKAQLLKLWPNASEGQKMTSPELAEINGAADFLFAAQLYEDAFDLYHVSLLNFSRHRESTHLLSFKAAVNCIRSSATITQHRCAIKIAESYLDWFKRNQIENSPLANLLRSYLADLCHQVNSIKETKAASRVHADDERDVPNHLGDLHSLIRHHKCVTQGRKIEKRLRPTTCVTPYPDGHYDVFDPYRDMQTSGCSNREIKWLLELCAIAVSTNSNFLQITLKNPNSSEHTKLKSLAKKALFSCCVQTLLLTPQQIENHPKARSQSSNPPCAQNKHFSVFDAFAALIELVVAKSFPEVYPDSPLQNEDQPFHMQLSAKWLTKVDELLSRPLITRPEFVAAYNARVGFSARRHMESVHPSSAKLIRESVKEMVQNKLFCNSNEDINCPTCVAPLFHDNALSRIPGGPHSPKSSTESSGDYQPAASYTSPCLHKTSTTSSYRQFHELAIRTKRTSSFSTTGRRALDSNDHWDGMDPLAYSDISQILLCMGNHV